MNRIIGGTVLRGMTNKTVTFINYGKPKFLKKHHVYFIGKKKSLDIQLRAIREKKPLAVVIPSHYRHLTFPLGMTVISVKDPYTAYWRLGEWNFQQYPVKVIGITGSAGKSTTTAMVAAILKTKYRFVQTTDNLNTATYLPNYLCQLTSRHHALLLEMGMKSLRNIARQCRVVRPHYGAITNVGEAHIGNLGGTHNIIKAKQELIEGMRPGGIVFLNADNARSRQLSSDHVNVRRYWFGIEHRAHVQATHVRYTSKGMQFSVTVSNRTYPFTLPAYGIHNVYNALAAIGICYTMGFTMSEIQRGLSHFKQPRMRLEPIRGNRGTLLINDAWNANPTATIAGLNVLTAIAGKRPSVAVLGDMLGLGKFTNSAHAKVGAYIARHPVDRLVTIGKRAEMIARTAIENGFDKEKVTMFRTREAAGRYLSRLSNCVIYFKASRDIHLEKLVKALKKR